ncbi:hypothetical protein V5F89_11135 [Pelagerythrobacter marensis]|uniref:Antitoxin SocA-like Panacea domain-containing protein n=1 Tax=Pelagerythrobacter marensis TaxID=543877 RepID=A0ABZ2D4Y4_9SPHN
MEQNLVALYELKRLTFLLGYKQNPESFNDALAFAYFNRVAPILHENIELETYGADPFADVYAVKAEFATEVLRYVDELERAEDFEGLGFYKLEEKFGGYKANRIKLIHALEYFRIDGRFDEKFWKAIEANAPAEANSLDSKFSPEDVYFV